LPLVIMPMHPMLDQAMVGKAVEATGAAVSIKRTATPEQIRAALETVLDEQHRAAAKAVAERWRGDDGTMVAADHILALQPKRVSP
jgi:UDP:flavonoid glycosyltransferase YjiC (YdhE family)